MTDELTPQPSDTAATLKMKIEKRQEELNSRKAIKVETDKVPGSDQTGIDKNQGKRTVVEEKPRAEKPQELNAPAKEEVNPIEWARKKGLTSEEAIARSLRAMEDEFHRRNQGKWKSQNDQAPVQNGQNGQYGPPPTQRPNYQPQQPVYQNPPFVAPPRQVLENIGRQYNMDPNDVERLMAFNNDFVEAKLQAERKQWGEKFTFIEKENKRNSEIMELMQDPFFRTPEVQMEINRVFEEDPEAYDRESDPNKWAYKEAALRLARRNLQGEFSHAVDSSKSNMFPTNPPKQVGQGGGVSNESGYISTKEFAALPPEEKRKVLNDMGLIQSKY